MLKAALITIFTHSCCCEKPTNSHLASLWIGEENMTNFFVTKLRVEESVELCLDQCITCWAGSIHFSYHGDSNTADTIAPVLIANNPCIQHGSIEGMIGSDAIVGASLSKLCSICAGNVTAANTPTHPHTHTPSNYHCAFTCCITLQVRAHLV